MPCESILRRLFFVARVRVRHPGWKWANQRFEWFRTTSRRKNGFTTLRIRQGEQGGAFAVAGEVKGSGFVFPGNCVGEKGGGGEAVGLAIEFVACLTVGLEAVDGELSGEG